MATFPTLIPASRTFTSGRHPHSDIATLKGPQTRVRTSNVLLDQRLRLTFTGLTESQMLQIRNHYYGQQGRFIPFFIPDELLSGLTTPANFTPPGYSWIYASSPEVEDLGLQRHTVSVELVTIPPEGASIAISGITVTISFAAGLHTVGAAGIQQTITASFVGGVVADNGSAGFNKSVPISFTAGNAEGLTGATGFSLSPVTFSLTPVSAENIELVIYSLDTLNDTATLTVTISNIALGL